MLTEIAREYALRKRELAEAERNLVEAEKYRDDSRAKLSTQYRRVFDAFIDGKKYQPMEELQKFKGVVLDTIYVVCMYPDGVRRIHGFHTYITDKTKVDRSGHIFMKDGYGNKFKFSKKDGKYIKHSFAGPGEEGELVEALGFHGLKISKYQEKDIGDVAKIEGIYDAYNYTSIEYFVNSLLPGEGDVS